VVCTGAGLGYRAQTAVGSHPRRPTR
jgi:hypothetical protein